VVGRGGAFKTSANTASTRPRAFAFFLISTIPSPPHARRHCPTPRPTSRPHCANTCSRRCARPTHALSPSHRPSPSRMNIDALHNIAKVALGVVWRLPCCTRDRAGEEPEHRPSCRTRRRRRRPAKREGNG
jgi:hypothetical protein